MALLRGEWNRFPLIDRTSVYECGQHFLHIAAAWGILEYVQMLLESGADPNVRDYFGAAPRHEAAFNGHIDVVKKLIECHADINARDAEGRTPFDLARLLMDKRSAMVQYLRSVSAN